MTKPWLLVGCLTLLACSERSLPLGETVDGSGNAGKASVMSGGAGVGSGGPQGGGAGSGTAGAPGGTGSVCAAPPASSLCTQNPAGPVSLNSESQLQAAMVGRWLLCGNQSVFAVDGGDVGLEITAGHHWYKLYAAPGAATVRGAGFDQEGTWTTVGLGQVNLEIFGGGTVITSPVFAAMPHAMRLNNNGVFVGNYIIDPSIATGSVRCPSVTSPTRSGDCTPPPDSLLEQTCADDLATDRTVGRWSRCGGSMPGAPLHDGVELAADGSFYFLHRDPMGGLVRGTSAADSGTAKVVVSAPCRADISINTRAGASVVSSTKHYQSTPRQLWIYTGPEWGDPERYTFVSP